MCSADLQYFLFTLDTYCLITETYYIFITVNMDRLLIIEYNSGHINHRFFIFYSGNIPYRIREINNIEYKST